MTENRLEIGQRGGGAPGVTVHGAFLERADGAGSRGLVSTCLDYASRQGPVDLSPGAHRAPREKTPAFQAPHQPITPTVPPAPQNIAFPKGTCGVTYCPPGIRVPPSPPATDHLCDFTQPVLRAGGARAWGDEVQGLDPWLRAQWAPQEDRG